MPSARDRGCLQTLYDLMVQVRRELHRLDGSPQFDHAPFNDPLFKEAAELNHEAYSVTVCAIGKRPARSET